MFFFYHPKHRYLINCFFSFSISLDSKVPKNSSLFLILLLIRVGIYTIFFLNPIFYSIYILFKKYNMYVLRHAGHCWRSRDELISDVLLWTPTHGRAKAGRPARTYIQQLCEDTGCCPEDLPRAMNDREKWRERVRYICATSTT